MMRGKKFFLVFAFVSVAFFAFAAYVFLSRGLVRPWQKNAALDAAIVGYCKLRGGQMITAGCGMTGCFQKCAIPFGDGGKPCLSSNQCSGKCFLSNYQPVAMPVIEQKKKLPASCVDSGRNTFECPAGLLKGTCQTRPLENCDFRWELDQSKIKLYSEGCTVG